MATASSLGLPRPFGPYELVRQLAVGGMAEVFVARARSVAGFEKIVALKTIHPRFSEDPEFARLLVEEANITAQLSHRNIVQVIDLGQIDDTHYIAMEYVDGMDLSRLITKMRERGQRCSPRFAAFIVREVCDGLEHAHRKSTADGKPLKIIHRDVSPPNILISSAGEVKLTDFGIAKAALRASSTEAGVVKGKYAYMPPEQAKGHPLDVRADVFSAGCVLYELATGQPVYKDAPLPALLDRVSRGIFDAPEKVRPDLPHALVAVIKKSLSAAAQDRYASARAMADDLNAFLYTLPPNPEFEVSQIVSGIQDGSRSSVPPMAGTSLFDDDSEESTQIESMAAMRSKMTPGEAAAAAAKPATSVPMNRAPDPDAFTDEPTRAMRREKLMPEMAVDDDDEPEPTAVGVRPNTAAPRVQTALVPAAGVRPAAGSAPGPSAAKPGPMPTATSSSKPAMAAATSSSKPATAPPSFGARSPSGSMPSTAKVAPAAASEPRLPARKATLIGAVAPVLPDRPPAATPPATPPTPPQRRSMPPPPPPAASRTSSGAMPVQTTTKLPANLKPAANTRPPVLPSSSSPLPAMVPRAQTSPPAIPPPASAPVQQQPPPSAPQPPSQQVQQAPAEAPMQAAPVHFQPSSTPQNAPSVAQSQPNYPQQSAPNYSQQQAPQQVAPNYPPQQQAPHPAHAQRASDDDRKQRLAVIIAGAFAAVGVVALVAVVFLGR